MTRSWAAAVSGKALVGALIAAGAAVIPLAQYTSAMLLWRDSPLNIQAVPDDATPVPARLVWHSWTYRFLTALAGMPMAGALVLYLCFAAAGAYLIVRILNPTFRVTTGVDWNRWLLFKTYMHTAPLIKVIVTMVPVQVAVFFLWLMLQAFLPSGPASSLTAAFLVGGTSWLALSRNGFVGDCDSGNYLLPSRREAVSLLLRGGVFGLIVWVLLFGLLEIQPEALIRMARALGGVGEQAWRPFAAVWLACAGLTGAACVLSAVGLGHYGVPRRSRMSVGILGAALTAVLATGTHWVWPEMARKRYDYDWKRKDHAYPRWWTTVAPNNAPQVWLALPIRGQWRAKPVAAVGISQIELSDERLRGIRAHLRNKRYVSALTSAGFVAEYDSACRELDATARLRACVEGARRSGDPLFSRTLLSDLWMLAGLPVAAKYTGVLRDERMLHYPTYDSRVPSGDLCARHGLLREALQWYAEAGLPTSRSKERASRMAIFTGGRIQGAFAHSAKGVALSAVIVPAQSEVTGLMARDQPAQIGPFMLREVIRSAKARPDGRFELTHVPEGEYRLGVYVAAPQTSRIRGIRVESNAAATQPFGINAAAPDVAVGTLRVRVLIAN